ncbi:MAG: hypothetical protein R3D65_04830 [Zhengella sp.]|uniref:hypothetical protein n=1 Tax=Zhengella sp. TaxID=2282762 RepID=UPI001D1D2FF4|nr:hypothetical protein [Notoacmeibacter sp.]MCC0028545.1 hypothetical protein [Brucellaceae bacterium]
MTVLKKPLTAGLCLIMIATMASACGRRGALDTPYEASVREAKETRQGGQTAPAPEKPVADKPFILDPLIE